jgi:hypothetical protein
MSYRDEYRDLNMEGLRDAVMDELASQYSVENLSMEDYDQRCSTAASAKTRTELASLVGDLPLLDMARDPASVNAASMPMTRGSSSLAACAYSLNEGAVKPLDTYINIFFGNSRRGRWKPAKTTSIINVFGGSDLDFTEALIPPGGLTVHAISVFGGCDIKVPEGVNVDVRGIGIFGGFDRKVVDTDNPNAPTITIDGIAVFGGCDVKTKRRR